MHTGLQLASRVCSGNAKSALLKTCVIKILPLIWLLIQILKTSIQAIVTVMITIRLLSSLFINGLVRELNWRKCFSNKVSITRSENSPPRWLHWSIIHTSNLPKPATTTLPRKNNLGRNDILVHVDYSEGYENKQQHEDQSAYFGHTSFRMFTACCYLWDILKITWRLYCHSLRDI